MPAKWGLQRRRSQGGRWAAQYPLKFPLIALPDPDATWAVPDDHTKTGGATRLSDVEPMEADEPQAGMLPAAEEEEQPNLTDHDVQQDAYDEHERPLSAAGQECVQQLEALSAHTHGDQHRPLSAAGQQCANVLAALRGHATAASGNAVLAGLSRTSKSSLFAANGFHLAAISWVSLASVQRIQVPHLLFLSSCQYVCLCTALRLMTTNPT